MHDVRQFCLWLSQNGAETGKITKELTIAYKQDLMDHYRISSVNSMLAPVNRFLRFCGMQQMCIKTCRTQRQYFRKEEELTKEGIPFSDEVEIGIMIETPAAVLMSDRLAKVVDFFSCGTNDLTQYTLACDRQNADLGRFYNPHHPAVLRALKMVCDNAHRNGIWVGICGELGADLTLTETFLSIGIDELSVSPRSVLPLRQKIREVNVSKVKADILADLLGDDISI